MNTKMKKNRFIYFLLSIFLVAIQWGCALQLRNSANGVNAEPCMAPEIPNDLLPYLKSDRHCQFILKNLPYGEHAKQRIDIYLPKHLLGAPTLFLVHGGAWRFGDKDYAALVNNKRERWVNKGIILISSNYRLIPDSYPAQQAEDVIRALAYAQRTLSRLSANDDSFVLMGHSAGAHLVSLINANPEAAYAHQVKPWLGTVALDGVALDVMGIMASPHPNLYDLAFGDDPEYWQLVSPKTQHTQQAKPLLLICSEYRTISCSQARSYANRARELGTHAEVVSVPFTHTQINRGLGKNSNYTYEVETFMKGLGPLWDANL